MAGDGAHGAGSVVVVDGGMVAVVVVVVVAIVVDVLVDDVVVEVVVVDVLVVDEVVVVLVVVVELVVVDVLVVDDVVVVVEVLVVDVLVEVVVLVVVEVLVDVDDVVLVVLVVVLVDVDVLVVVLVVEVVVVGGSVVVVGTAEISQFVPENPDWQTHVYPPPSVARQMPPLRHGLGLHGFTGGMVVVVVVGPGVQTAEPGGADVPRGQAVQMVAAPSENVFAGHVRQDDQPVNGW